APSLPAEQVYSPDKSAYPLFVSDDALRSCSRPIDTCLYSNITTLLITREVLLRFCRSLAQNMRHSVASQSGPAPEYGQATERQSAVPLEQGDSAILRPEVLLSRSAGLLTRAASRLTEAADKME